MVGISSTKEAEETNIGKTEPLTGQAVRKKGSRTAYKTRPGKTEGRGGRKDRGRGGKQERVQANEKSSY